MTDRKCSALDSSVVVAAVSPWHEHHPLARKRVAELFAEPDRQKVVLPRPALVEAYSVLTRLPKPQRLIPGQAFELLKRTFEGRVQISERNFRESWEFLESLACRGTAGGAAHDAVIVDLARQAGATAIFTLNLRHFLPLAPPGIEILPP